MTNHFDYQLILYTDILTHSASTGVLKGLQAVATFVTSHYSFCGIQKSQCFTVTKGVSLVVVLTGEMLPIASYYATVHCTKHS